jgi:hypothetical protein
MGYVRHGKREKLFMEVYILENLYVLGVRGTKFFVEQELAIWRLLGGYMSNMRD